MALWRQADNQEHLKKLVLMRQEMLGYPEQEGLVVMGTSLSQVVKSPRVNYMLRSIFSMKYVDNSQDLL